MLSEIELGWLCAPLSRIAAITGTNGKTTVTMLVEKIIADDLPVRFQLQLHKYLWPPAQRGV